MSNNVTLKFFFWMSTSKILTTLIECISWFHCCMNACQCREMWRKLNASPMLKLRKIMLTEKVNRDEALLVIANPQHKTTSSENSAITMTTKIHNRGFELKNFPFVSAIGNNPNRRKNKITAKECDKWKSLTWNSMHCYLCWEAQVKLLASTWGWRNRQGVLVGNEIVFKSKTWSLSFLLTFPWIFRRRRIIKHYSLVDVQALTFQKRFVQVELFQWEASDSISEFDWKNLDINKAMYLSTLIVHWPWCDVETTKCHQMLLVLLQTFNWKNLHLNFNINTSYHRNHHWISGIPKPSTKASSMYPQLLMGTL